MMMIVAEMMKVCLLVGRSNATRGETIELIQPPTYRTKKEGPLCLPFLGILLYRSSSSTEEKKSLFSRLNIVGENNKQRSWEGMGMKR